MPVIVRDETGRIAADAMDLVRAVAESALAAMAAPAGHEACIVLADDALLQRLNLAFRGVDRPTDVLSFPFDAQDLPPGETPYLGDVVISVDRAVAGARTLGGPVVDELRLLAVHGVLHLVGHEDETDAGARTMRQIEAALGVRPIDSVD